MKFSTWNKKAVVFLTLFSLLTSSVQTKPTESEQVKESGVTLAQQINENPQLFKQIQEFVLRGQIPSIFSKIEALKLAISNKAVSLTSQEKITLFSNLASTKDILAKNIELLTGSEQSPIADKQSLVACLMFSKQLISYLDSVIKNKFKKLSTFSFNYKQEQSDLTTEQIIELFQEVGLQFEQFEASFNDIGMSERQKANRKIAAFFDKYGIWSKAKIVTLGVFFALLARYLLKDPIIKDPSITDKRSEYTLLNKIDDFVGERPDITQIPVLDPTALGGFKFQKKRGTGVFGRTHSAIEPLAKIAAFPVALTAVSNTMVEGINGWKSLHKNPSTFFKLEELFHNKKQTVSAFDELFLSSAIEHTAPRITFDDLAGLHEQKKELQPVINYLLNPELFEKTGTSIEKGYLLYGPTRTGKTHFAEALAGELVLKHKKKLGFIKIRGSELRMVGVKKVLDMVSKYAPCIVFIDELDLLNLQRDHNTMLLDEFLTCMKLDTGNHQVIFLAATNRIDHIDHALLQPGRFGKIIPFEAPSSEDRQEFFKQHLSRKNMYDPSLLDINRLVQETETCSFGDLASIINSALSIATQKREMLSYRHFDASIDSFKRKIADSNINLPEEERKIIAAHLAGQALTYHLLPTGEQLLKVTMLPIQKKVAEENIWLSNLSTAKKVTTYGDVFTLHKKNTGGFDSPEQKVNRIKALLAGHAAENILLGASSYGYRGENQEQARLLIETIVFQGLKKEHFSRDAADKKLNEVMQLLKQYEAEVTQLLQTNKDKLDKLAQALNAHLTLTAEDVSTLIK